MVSAEGTAHSGYECEHGDEPPEGCERGPNRGGESAEVDERGCAGGEHHLADEAVDTDSVDLLKAVQQQRPHAEEERGPAQGHSQPTGRLGGDSEGGRSQLHCHRGDEQRVHADGEAQAAD